MVPGCKPSPTACGRAWPSRVFRRKPGRRKTVCRKTSTRESSTRKSVSPKSSTRECMITLDEPAETRRPGSFLGGDRVGTWFASPRVAGFARPRLHLHQLQQVAFSMADQALAVGGMFLVNLVLARTQTREEYGMFALSYSALSFFMGLHNAAILEPFTVYGSGRHRSRLTEYFQLMCWGNAVLGLLLTAVLLSLCLALHWLAPHL